MKRKTAVTLDLSPEIAQKLGEYANDSNMSMSKYAEWALKRMFLFDNDARTYFSNVEKLEERKNRIRREKKVVDNSNDEAVMLLKKAHNAKVNFTRISEYSGVHRRLLYAYINGERECRDEYREAIKNAIVFLAPELSDSQN